MPDRLVLLAAAAAFVGGTNPHRGSLVAAVGLIVVAVAAASRTASWRWWLVVAILVGAVVSVRARSQIESLAPIQHQLVEGSARLVSDPEWRFGAVTVDVDVGGIRLTTSLRGGEARRLADSLSGEQVWVRGRASPRPPGAWWLEQRGVVGRLDVDELGAVRPGSVLSRAANGLRRTVESGAETLDADGRSLFTGLVYGDDRTQPPEVTDDFRRSGLAHLLAVSGQNVLFVVATVAPLARRLAPRPRAVLIGAVLVMFATITRFEPSVLRAVTMAGLVAGAELVGRVAPPARVLGLAVIALLIADPSLSRSLGFRLSVAATAGILWLAEPVAARLPGPRPLAEAIGVVVAAQMAVAPLVAAAFGGVPVASVPANLLAAPAAGAVMMWGGTAGLVAGLVGDPIAGWLHVPTRAALWWISGVARWSAGLPFGTLGLAELAVVTLAGVASALVPRRVVHGCAAAAIVLAVSSTVVIAPSPGHHLLGTATELWVSHGDPGAVVLVVSGRADPETVLQGLRDRGVRRVDLVVATSGGRTAASVVNTVRARIAVERIWAPRRHQIVGASAPAEGAGVVIGELAVAIVAADDSRIEVSVGASPG